MYFQSFICQISSTGLKCERFCLDCFTDRSKIDFYDEELKNILSEEISEICEQLNISPSPKMFQVFKKLSKDNKKISKNLLQLSAIFYVANAEFYLPINRLGELWDQTTDKKNINVPLLNAKISESLMKANLTPPLENFYFIIDYTLKKMYLPSKYSSKLKQIMEIIASSLENIFFIKTPILLCLAFYFYKNTSHFCTKGNHIFNILYVPWRTFVINKEYVLSCDELSKKFKTFDYCIELK